MTIDQYRRLVLSMPDATEGAHMGHPDFRVKGKIFATLFKSDGFDVGVVKLKPEQQRQFVRAKPGVFQPVKGGWGRQGCTQVRLDAVKKSSLASLRSAIMAAWLNTAPKKLLEDHDGPKRKRKS